MLLQRRYIHVGWILDGIVCDSLIEGSPRRERERECVLAPFYFVFVEVIRGQTEETIATYFFFVRGAPPSASC
jgi:hypothetical protein